MLYQINIDNDGDGVAEVIYSFQFTTTVLEPEHLPVQHRPHRLPDRPPLQPAPDLQRQPHRRQQPHHGAGHRPAVPAVQHRPAVDAELRRPGRRPPSHPCPGGRTVFAGQRAEGFYVDLGAVFDLGDLRPFENLHAFGNLPARNGVNATKQVNVHSIALKVPISDLTAGSPVIGVWATASRQKVRILDQPNGATVQTIETGPFVQVSRLGNPLFNEVLVPMAQKDYWNTQPPVDDSQFAAGVHAPRAGPAAQRAVPRRVPQPGGLHQAPRRPPGHPAHRHPGRRRVARPTPPSPARCWPTSCASTRRSRRRSEPQRPRRPRRRPGRLPQRPPGVRRRVHHRAAGHRRRHHPPGRSQLHARRRRRRWSPTGSRSTTT